MGDEETKGQAVGGEEVAEGLVGKYADFAAAIKSSCLSMADALRHLRGLEGEALLGTGLERLPAACRFDARATAYALCFAICVTEFDADRAIGTLEKFADHIGQSEHCLRRLAEGELSSFIVFDQERTF